jgi:uncharacterized membrane protein YkoI
MIVLAVGAGIAQEKKVALKSLPPAAQKTVQEQLKGAQLKGLSQETEDGKTVYELETMVNGKTRDVLIDANGTILEVEEATTLDAIPAQARAAIEKAATGGKIKTVETVTKGGKVYYEAAITKAGKGSEIQVTADGAIVK